MISFRKIMEPKKTKPEPEITMTGYAPTAEEIHTQLQMQSKEAAQQRIRNFQKDDAGLYPHEILMLSYLEKYASGAEPAKFWQREYDVEDVPALIGSLEKRGFAENGKLTEKGKNEIAKNEYVLYMHRHKNLDISMDDMCILVQKHPNMKYRDIIWGELNRMSMEYFQAGKFGLYRNVTYNMYLFLMEEKRYNSALEMLGVALFCDLNLVDFPFFAPAIKRNARSLGRKLDMPQEEMLERLKHSLDNMWNRHNLFTADEIANIIIAYAFGQDEIADEILDRLNQDDFAKTICPACRSRNVTMQTVTESISPDKAKTKRRKKKHHNAAWWIFVGWWWAPTKWALLFLFARIEKIFTQNQTYTHNIAVCQTCGHSWEV